MNNLKKTLASGLVVLFMILGFIACDDDFTTVGDEIIENNIFTTDLFTDTQVKAYNKRLAPVQGNALPVYQLGRNDDPVYGTTFSNLTIQASLVAGTEDPEFGDKTQAEEDADQTDLEEEETVTEVWLNIPYFSSSSVNDDNETVVVVDSLYGNVQQETEFTLRVQELTYFLRTLDENGDPQIYFSDEDFSTRVGQTLYENTEYFVDQDQIEVVERDAQGNIVLDDDGNPVIEETLSPRIRVPLNTQFFQEQIIDKEGDEAFLNNNAFRASDIFRGLHITTENAQGLMLLDLENATIEINYTYMKLNTQGNTDDSDDTEDLTKASYSLSLSSGNIINTFSTPTFIPDVTANENNLYLKGGEGSMTVIELFGPDTDNNGVADQLEELRENGWLINEANLTFYVNQNEQNIPNPFNDNRDPQRVYLYNMDNSIFLEDYRIDESVNPTKPELSGFVHGGILERDDQGDALKYKVRITEHINNVIRKDSTNVKLGLVASSTSSIIAISNGQVQTTGTEDEFLPLVSIMNPLGTVLYGSTLASPEDKRLKLEIFYTVSETN